MTASATITQILENMLSISTHRKLSNIVNKGKMWELVVTSYLYCNLEGLVATLTLPAIKTDGQEAEKICARR